MKVSTQHLISSVVTDLSLKCQISTIDCASVPVWHRLTLHYLSVWDNIQISPTHLKTSPAVAASRPQIAYKRWMELRILNYEANVEIIEMTSRGQFIWMKKRQTVQTVKESERKNKYICYFSDLKTFFTSLLSHLMVLSFTEYSMIFIL